METINAKGKRTLVIGDMHMPYMHKDAFRFLAAIKKKYRPDIIINIGDEVDGHAISFYQSDSDLFSAGQELQTAIDLIHSKDGIHQLFPVMRLLESNHGSLHIRKAKSSGLPLHYLKSYQDIYGTPGWTWHDDIILKTNIGDVYLCHGKSGVYNKMSKEMGMSCVQGHYHSKFEVTWTKTALSERFNAFTGCLINNISGDKGSIAFEYSRTNLPVALLGSLVISKEGYPRLIKMQLNSKDRWIGKLP